MEIISFPQQVGVLREASKSAVVKGYEESAASIGTMTLLSAVELVREMAAAGYVIVRVDQ